MNNFNYLILLTITLFCGKLNAQNNDRGNINLQVGSLLVYNTVSIGYESFDLTQRFSKFQIRANVKSGIWNASITNPNNGWQNALGISFAYGNQHKIEFANDLVLHFDSGLKNQGITYIASTYRPFLGYRFQSPERKLIFRLGFGWREVIQCSIGFNL